MNENALLFRRQYLLGPSPVQRDDWRHQRIGSHTLSWHPDLEVHIAEHEGRTLALLGFWIDPARPDMDSGAILREMLGRSFDDVLAATVSLSGRWALIAQTGNAIRVAHDPCGLRQVHYIHDGGRTICASQPELIRTVVPLTPTADPDWRAFTASAAFRRRESAVIGNATEYDGCFRLLPNHALDCTTGTAHRYFPASEMRERSIDEVADEAAEMLRGSVLAAARRGPVMLPVTAGWDSRVLLAASRSIKDQVHYYVHRRGGDNHPDIRVPRRLSSRLGFSFDVNDTPTDVPEWFTRIIADSVTGARTLDKTGSIYFHHLHSQGRANINGNASEIARQFYAGKRGSDWTAEQLASIVEYPGDRCVIRALDQWLAGVHALNLSTFDVLDLLYWEQRMGVWGALYPAEQDIAVEEFSPFNNRALLTALLSVPASERAAPKYSLYREIIRRLWPEVLAEPINPRSAMQRVRALMPRGLKSAIKRAIR